jgi:hypothetical protein
LQPGWQALSVLVNCEYRLYILNQDTPLRNNPFLSHWVEAIQRLDRPPALGPGKRDGSLTSSDIHTVRVELIKALLQSRNPSQFARMSPKKLYADYVELRQTGEFDVRVYVRMLEEEEIYERTPEPVDHHVETRGNALEKTDGKDKRAGRPKLSDFQQWKQDMLDRLQREPDTAISELTHLPIELSYLDFLTTLLQEKTLESFSIESPPVISDYIQHALRLTETMGQPPGTSESTSAPSSASSGVNGDSEHAELTQRGREAQTRAVKLLLLFIKNVMRKDLVPLEAIYFEIQEICVRYVWIREVREFRAFVEEGVGGLEGM